MTSMLDNKENEWYLPGPSHFDTIEIYDKPEICPHGCGFYKDEGCICDIIYKEKKVYSPISSENSPYPHKSLYKKEFTQSENSAFSKFIRDYLPETIVNYIFNDNNEKEPSPKRVKT